MPPNPLPLSIQKQECGEWCWAAVAVAIGTFYEDEDCPKKQCALVNQVLQLTKDCCTECRCTTDPFDSCNQPENLGDVLGQYKHCRDGNNGVASMQFSEIQQEINDGHPIAVSVQLNDSAASGHAVVIYGYTADKRVFVADPMKPTGTLITVSFDDLTSGASATEGVWQAGFRTKRKDE